MRTIKQILIDRDGMSCTEADEAITETKLKLDNKLRDPDTYGNPNKVCADEFGLEPDYLIELIDM